MGHFNKALVALRIGELRQALCRRLFGHAVQCSVIKGQFKLVWIGFMPFSPPETRPLRPFVLPFGYESFDK
jgi:hypothetical protein